MGVFTSEVIFNYRRGFSLLLLAAILLAAPAIVFGQAYFGTVSGVLTDPTGAVVQGAKVTLTDQEKGYKFNTTSDSTGRYLYRSVPPGLYSVSAEMQGFEKIVRTDIRVNINDNATANLILKVASSTQTVDVQAQSATIDTQDATTGQVIDRRFINELPLIDRYVMDLTFLTPGVTEMDDQCKLCGGTNFVSNGSRGATADILMDGASITNYEPNGGVTEATYTPSPDAVEEFKVQQSNFSAEYGFSGASVVNMLTRSGTNSFHGSAYDYLRNQILDANSWFNNFYGDPIPSLRRNEFGGMVSGPIFKNKTFFFFDYDGTRQSTMGSSTAGVPSALERTGDFGEICSYYDGTFDQTVGSPTYGECSDPRGQIWDPYSGVYVPTSTDDGLTGPGPVRSAYIQFNKINEYISPGNPNLPADLEPKSGIPGNLIDPVSQNMMNLFPLPEEGMTGTTIHRNWSKSGAYRNYNDQFDIKIDHRFNEKNMLSAKYSRQWSHGTSYNCFDNFTDPCSGGPNISKANLFAINETYTISPTLLLTTTFGITRGSFKQTAYNPSGTDPLNGNKVVTDPLSELGLPSYLGTNGWEGVPAMWIGGYNAAGTANLGNDPWSNYKQGKLTGQLGVILSKVSGAHELKFGAEGRLHQMNYIQTNSPVGTFSFDVNGTSMCTHNDLLCGGDGMASFLMGQMNGDTSYEIQDEPATEDHQFAVFANDNWKVNHKLTVNIGLRYDVSLPRTDRHNRQDWLDMNVVNPLNGGTISYIDESSGENVTRALYGGEVFANSHQRTIVNTDWKDVQPRVGFAYQITGKGVVRGGYGIYYSQPRNGATGVAPYGSQGYNVWTSAITTYNEDGATPYLHMNNPYPNGLTQPAGNSLGLMNDVGYGANGPLRNVTNTPYEQSWSFGFQWQLPWNLLINAEYLGKKGTHLYYAGANQLDHLGPEVEKNSVSENDAEFSLVDNPFLNIITDPNSSLSYTQIQKYQREIPYPEFTSVTSEVPPIANSIYHGLQLTAQKRYSNGLQLLVTYAWSKSIDDASAQDDNTTWLGSFISLLDPNKPWLERSLSTFDIPYVVQFSYTYDLPVGRGKGFGGNMPRVLDAVVGGWKTSGVWRIADGRPLNMSLADGQSIATYGGQRPDIVGTPKRLLGKNWRERVASNDPTQQGYFVDNSVFQKPAPYVFGTAPRSLGLVRTPLSFSSDLSLAKEFSLAKVREGLNFELRAEAQNAFNHPTFGTPNTSVDSGDDTFGFIGYTSNGPREVQLSLKVTF